MIKVSDGIREIIKKNPFMEFGIANDLFNLTKLAKFITPMLEIRTKKNVQTSTVLMALSRLQRQSKGSAIASKNFQIEKISIETSLVVVNFLNNQTVIDLLNNFENSLQGLDGFWNITKGGNEIAVFFEYQFLSKIPEKLSSFVKYQNNNAACVRVKFSEIYFDYPGIIYAFIQKLTLQNINLLEISSTYTELNFFVRKADLSLTFETIHDYFL